MVSVFSVFQNLLPFCVAYKQKKKRPLIKVKSGKGFFSVEAIQTELSVLQVTRFKSQKIFLLSVLLVKSQHLREKSGAVVQAQLVERWVIPPTGRLVVRSPAPPIHMSESPLAGY